MRLGLAGLACSALAFSSTGCLFEDGTAFVTITNDMNVSVVSAQLASERESTSLAPIAPGGTVAVAFIHRADERIWFRAMLSDGNSIEKRLPYMLWRSTDIEYVIKLRSPNDVLASGKLLSREQAWKVSRTFASERRPPGAE